MSGEQSPEKLHNAGLILEKERSKALQCLVLASKKAI